jgi:hypothetical protein
VEQPEPDEFWIIDTSSIIQVRRIVPVSERKGVLAALSSLVDDGGLVFPEQVFDELDRWVNPDPSKPDLPLEWARKCKPRATRHGRQFEELRFVQREVPEVNDPDRPGVEEADPYVLALAVYLTNAKHRCTVVTEERKDRPDKMSMTSACGILRLPSLPVEIFLARRGVWKRTT